MSATASARLPEQLFFPEWEPEPRQIYRLILMILLPADIAQATAQLGWALRARHRLDGRPLRTDRFHVTLHGLGEFTSVPADLLATAAPAEAEFLHPSFDVTFDHVDSFKRGSLRSPLVLLGSDLGALQRLHRALAEAFVETPLGASRSSQSYNPHVTLLYDWQRIPRQRIDALTWTVNDFSLVLSVVGRTRYIHLRHYRLTG